MTQYSSDVVYREEVSIHSLRLLTIESRRDPVGGDSLLRCHLTTYALAEAPEYNALSYAWKEPQSEQAAASVGVGEAEPKYCILLAGKQVPVTANLHHALHELCRHRSRTRWWIDALCINQSNIEERTAQVNIMHKIFGNASTVYVWLGSDPNNEAYTIREFFRALLAKYMDKELDIEGNSKYNHGWLLRGDDPTHLAAGLPSRRHPIWMSVVRFWNRAWFTRVWVKQEVALAGGVRMWCGCTEFTLEELMEASGFHIFSGLSESLMVLKPRDQFSSAPATLIGSSVIAFQDWQLFLQHGNRFDEAEIFTRGADRLCGPKSEEQHPLLRIFAIQLLLARRDDATDPRDKIFPLLILMKQIAENNELPEVPLTIDYSKSKEDVYREATSWVIRESGYLGALCLLHPDRPMSKVINGYSWVPDFTSPPIQALRIFLTDTSCQTDKFWMRSDISIGSSIKSSNLEVHAKLFGTVDEIGDSSDSMLMQGCFEMTARLLLNCPLTMPSGLNRLDEWRRTMCGETSTPLSAPLPDDADNTSPAAFKEWLVWHILRKGINDGREGRIQRFREHLAKMPSLELLAEIDDAEPKMLPDFGFWQNTVTNQERLQASLTDHRPRFRVVEIGGRRLFRSTNCLCIGIGPDDMEAGDELWLVAGCLFPVVLRRLGGSSTGSAIEDDTRLVVGEAYINSLSDMLTDILPSDWQCLKLE